MKFFSLLTAACASALLCSAAPALSAETYPSRSVRLIVPYPPGGAGDIIGRLLAYKLTEGFAQQVVVDNRGGGGQVIATQLAATAPPDGHTLFLSSATHGVNPALRRNLPYDTLKDFTPITLVAESPLLFLAHPSTGITSIKELIAAARAKPGQINYASSGPGTGGHMSVELLKSLANIDLVHVPYKGGGPAVVDLLAGRMQVMCTSPLPTMPHVKAGKLRALAVTSATRASFAPDIPAVAETIPGYQTTLWYALLAPAGTPPGIVQRVRGEAVKAIQSKEVVQQLEAAGARPIGSTPQELQAHIRTEMAQWTKLVKQAGIKLD